jgi:antitoxin PrlF
MIRSKLTSKSQTTVPIDGERVILTRAPQDAAEDPFGTFSEWNSEADRVGYAGL